MLISEAADRAGVNVQTLRYYERRGLLPAPRRRASGYRDVPEDAVRRVRFIKRAQELGFTLEEVAELLKLRTVGRANRARVRAMAERRVEQIDRKIAELGALRDALRVLVHRCHEGAALECPIIEALEAPAGDLQ
jgi:Hg(II)-responsive transcriptional regulator